MLTKVQQEIAIYLDKKKNQLIDSISVLKDFFLSKKKSLTLFVKPFFQEIFRGMLFKNYKCTG